LGRQSHPCGTGSGLADPPVIAPGRWQDDTDAASDRAHLDGVEYVELDYLAQVRGRLPDFPQRIL